MQIKICRCVREDADNGRYWTYGLKMGDMRVDDISTRWRTVLRLRGKLLRNHVAVLHFPDVIEDFLAE